MYKKSDHKVKKSIKRKNKINLKLRLLSMLSTLDRPAYIQFTTGFSGTLSKSVWVAANRPSSSKYIPHQGNQEQQRRMK